MILIFDFFETLTHNRSTDFNRGLKVMWENYYKDKCTFEEIKEYGEELFQHMLDLHRQGKEYAFVRDEIPQYAEKYGGEIIHMTANEEADFLMLFNEMETMPGIPEALSEFEKMRIPMYVLSNSGFTAEALSVVLDRLGIRKYFANVWSSADFGRIKPCKDFFDMAIKKALSDHLEEKRKDIVFVGDMYETDVIGSHNANIGVIWFNHRQENNPDLFPVHVISNAGDLIQIVKEIVKSI